MNRFIFSFFDVFVAFGILQGIFCSVLLLTFKRKELNKKLLALVLIIFALLSFKIELHTIGLWQTNLFCYFPLAIDLAIQPAIYIYILSLSVHFKKFDFRLLCHFIPAFIFMLHAIVVYIAVYPVSDMALKDVVAEDLHFNQVKNIEDYFSVISAVIYWIMGYRSVTKYNQLLFSQTTSGLSPLSWIKNLLILMAALVIALTVNIFSDIIFNLGRHQFFHWQLFYIILSLITYYLGFTGYYQSAIIPVVNISKVPQFSDNDIDRVKKEILYQLEINKLFLEHDISLITLSNKIGSSHAIISVTINQRFGVNFRNLVNGYRVDEVKKKLVDPNLQHLSILGMALESGFNSEASFYRVFKKHTGMSPANYLEEAKSKNLGLVI